MHTCALSAFAHIPRRQAQSGTCRNSYDLALTGTCVIDSFNWAAYVISYTLFPNVLCFDLDTRLSLPFIVKH